MKTKRIITALLIGMFALGSITNWALARDGWRWGDSNGRGHSGDQNNSSDNGNDSSNNNNNTPSFHSGEHQNNTNNGNINTITGSMSNTNTFRTAVDNFGWTSEQSHITRRNTESAQEVLSRDQKDTINKRIDNIPLIRRLDFLISVLTRIETLRASIEASTRSADAKAQLIALLDSIVTIIQDRITTDIGSGSGVINDNTPPVTSSLSVSEITSSSAMISTTVNENGTGFFVVTPSGGTLPTAAQIKAGQNGSGVIQSIAGSSALVTGMNQFIVTGLAPSTAYTVYFVAEDVFENLQSTVTSRDFTTLSGTSDTTPPVTSAVSLTGITNTGVVLQMTSNESGTLYIVSLLSGATAPTAAQVKAWQDASGATASLHGTFAMVTGMNQLNLTGFAPATNYIIYLVAQDTSGNLQSTVTSKPFSTLPLADITPPVITAISLTGITNSGAVLQFTANEQGLIHSVTLLSGATAPTVAQVKAGEDASGALASLRETSTIFSGANQINLSGLNPSIDYTVYFVTEDMVGNTETVLHSLNFSSTP